MLTLADVQVATSVGHRAELSNVASTDSRHSYPGYPNLAARSCRCGSHAIHTGGTSGGISGDLFTDEFFKLTELLLDRTGNLFRSAFRFEGGIVGEFASLLFRVALYFVEFTFELLPCAVWHFFVLDSASRRIPRAVVLD